MNRRTKSILAELSSAIPNRGREDVLKARANHIIVSAINLLESIDALYDADTAAELKNRFISSIRGADPARFERMVGRLLKSEKE